jgi:nicotinate-nucleotide adenylyltransferase
MASQRIGILGGTFDPIHLGHLVPAKYACDHLRLDRLYLVPSASPVHRPRHMPAAPEHRLRMCELAAEPFPRFSVSDVEIRRSEPSYTVLTIEHFAHTLAPNATFFLLIGEDNLPLLYTWHRLKDILALATPALLPRPGTRELILAPLVDAVGQRAVQAILASRIPAPMLDISGTEIRTRIREGRPIAGLVPPTVAAYIATHGLYRN